LNYGRINSTFEPVKLVINSQFYAILPAIYKLSVKIYYFFALYYFT